MRLRRITAMLAGGVLAGAAAIWLVPERALPLGPEVADGAVAFRMPMVGDVNPVVPATDDFLPGFATPTALPAAPAPDVAHFAPMPPLLPPWTAKLGPGDTFDGVLRRAGLPADLRQVFSRAMQTQYDLANLRPGDEVAVQNYPDGRPFSGDPFGLKRRAGDCPARGGTDCRDRRPGAGNPRAHRNRHGGWFDFRYS